MDAEDDKPRDSIRILNESKRATGRLVGYGLTIVLIIAAVILLFVYVF